MADKLTIKNDPLQITLEAAINLYPDIQANIYMNPTLRHIKIWKFQRGICGYTEFRENEIPEIHINANIPYLAIVETLAHELAHVAVGIVNEHNNVWYKAFDDIFNEYMRIGNERFGE